MAAGRFADAIPIYQELCRAMPANTGLRLNLALAYHMAGKHRDAIPEFERVVKADPNNFPALLSLGVSELEVNEPAKAVASLQRAVMMQPSNPDARGMLANALLSLQRPKDAAAHFRKLTALTPNDPKAWHGLGRSYEALAARAFADLNKTAEGSPAWLALVAESRLARRQYRSAFYFYRQALEKQPNLRGVHAGIAAVYRATNHPEWAAAEDKKERLVPSPNCVRDKAECDFMGTRYLEAASGASPLWRARAYNELALHAFSKLGSLPESIELHALKAEIAANQGQYKDAAGEWRAALKLAPEDPRLEHELATALYQGADYDAALPLLEQLLARDPKSAELNFFIGDALLHREQPEKAAPYLEAAVRLDPKLIPAHASLGQVYSRLAKTSAAIPHLQLALPSDDDGSLHYQLARAYEAVGDSEKAKGAMQQYQAIQKRVESEKLDLEEKVQITAP